MPWPRRFAFGPRMSSRSHEASRDGSTRDPPRFLEPGVARLSPPDLSPPRGPQAGRCPHARACPRVRSARAPPVTQSGRRRPENRRPPSIPPPRIRALAKEPETRDPLERHARARRPPTSQPPERRGKDRSATSSHVHIARFDPACASHAWRRARRSLPARLASRTACAARAPGVEGRFSRPSAKKAEIGCTRGAFHHRTTSAVRPGQESRVRARMSSSPQFVTSLWGTRGAFFVPHLPGCLDGLPSSWKRRPSSAGIGPWLLPRRRWTWRPGDFCDRNDPRQIGRAHV